jgi:CheY-like chemotaxis protein
MAFAGVYALGHLGALAPISDRIIMTSLLVVEDDPVTRKIIVATLSNSSYRIEAADDGQAGLEAALARVPDLVVTDVIMPRMDGWRLVQSLRADARTSMVPVIFLTILHEEQYRLRGFGLGADDYISKPVNADELRFRIDRSIQRAVGMTQSAQWSLKASVFAGDLGQFGPAALISLISGERKSGMLAIHHDGTICRLRFRAGVLTGARTSTGTDDVVGAESVYDALGWWSGFFSFEASDGITHDASERVDAPVTYLLMEAARRLDEMAR